jgi:hypothetical protein
MAEDKPESKSGGNRNLLRYGRQIFIVFILAIIGFAVLLLFLGLGENPFPTDIVWTNITVLVIWLAFVILSFWSHPSGELWRDYRWIVAPAVLVLLFLLDSSWAQSRLSTQFSEKIEYGEYPVKGLIIHVETPNKILYDTSIEHHLSLWINCVDQCASQPITLSSNMTEGILFAVQTPSGKPLQWQKKLKISLPYDGSALVVSIRQPAPSEEDQTANIMLTTTALKTVSLDGNRIQIEGQRAAQMRYWKKNFLETSSIIVALISAIFAGIKQWEEERRRQEEEEKRQKNVKEEEEKRRRSEEIQRAIDGLDTGLRNDFPSTLKQCTELMQDWSLWKISLQDRFREKFSSFANKEIWAAISSRNPKQLAEDVELCIKLCDVIFESREEPIALKFKELEATLQQDVRAALSLLRDYPESITIVRQIIRSLSDESKKKIIDDYKNEFQQQIIDLKNDFGFVDLNSYPLQRKFQFYADLPPTENRLAVWLEKHRIGFSPFMDASNPYILGPSNDKLLTDRELFISLVPTGFKSSVPENPVDHFEFANPWDVGAALFEYVRNLPPKIKNESFVVLLTPTMLADFGLEQPHELFLHALAEQWLWILAETPTRYYSLKETQQALLGRLLCWHGGSVMAAIHSLEHILEKKIDEESTKNFLTTISGWLNHIDKSSLRKEEIIGLIELRPFPTQITLLLVSSIDWWMNIGGQISPELHTALDKHANWLQIHRWALAHFLISEIKPRTISPLELEKQCQQRMLICSRGKVEAFEQLFAPHSKESADRILAYKANGSPGTMVRLGQELLLRHVAQHPNEDWLQIEDLEALKG